MIFPDATGLPDSIQRDVLTICCLQVRSLTNMCSAPLDLFSMLELGGQQPSNAMVAMNQLTTGGQNLTSVNRRRKKVSGVPNPKRMFEEVNFSLKFNTTFFKNGPFPASFSLFPLHMTGFKLRTADLCSSKRPLYQLTHNNFFCVQI